MPKVSYYNSLLFEIYAPEKYEMFLTNIQKQQNMLKSSQTF